MLGILLIYFIGKRFFDLADEFNQNKWLYAILSIVIYYAAGVVFVIVLAILNEIFELGFDWENSFGIQLLAIPIGLAADYGLYMILKNKWKKSVVIVKDEIQDIGKDIKQLEEEN